MKTLAYVALLLVAAVANDSKAQLIYGSPHDVMVEAIRTGLPP